MTLSDLVAATREESRWHAFYYLLGVSRARSEARDYSIMLQAMWGGFRIVDADQFFVHAWWSRSAWMRGYWWRRQQIAGPHAFHRIHYRPAGSSQTCRGSATQCQRGPDGYCAHCHAAMYP